MKLSQIISFLIICGTSLATDVTYNVIAFPDEHGGSSVALVLDGKIIPMTSNIQGKWNVKAEKPTQNFHFSIISNTNQVVKEEPLNREWDSKNDASDNYIFGKLNNNIKNDDLPKIPRAFPKVSNEKEFSKIFQEGQVKVINIVADQTALDSLHQNIKLATSGTNSDTPVEMYFIGDDSVKHFTNVTLSFSGMGSRGYSKRPYKIKLSDDSNDSKDNRSLFGRTSFKLRSLVYDCSYVKQKIATDVGHAMGAILPQVGFARLYMNGVPYGLYELADNPKKNWIKKIIHEDKLPSNEKVGSYYKGVSYVDESDNLYPASLNVETDEKMYEILYECENEDDNQTNYTDLKEFINWINTINNSTSVEEIKSKFEVDIFLKYMVIEYLIGHWDGYWIGGNNFYVYKNPTTDKYMFMSLDYDITLGKWDPHPPETTYQNWIPTRFLATPSLIQKIIFHPSFQKQFEDYLITTVKKTFNIYALGPRLDYFKNFLYDDISWDRVVEPKAVSVNTEVPFTLEDAMNSYEEAACESSYGVKQWISLRSEFVAKTFNFTIPSELDYSLGSYGEKIVKEKVEASQTSEPGAISNLYDESSATTLKYSYISALVILIVALLL